VPVFPLSTPYDGSFRQSMHAARIELVSPAPPAPAPPPSPPPPPPPSPPPAPPTPSTTQRAAKLVLSPLSWAPSRAVAGRAFTVRARASVGPGRALASGRPLCAARLGGRGLPALSRTLRRGVVRCVWRLPATAAGRRLTVGVGASSPGLAAKRARTFRVRG
jgi:hypothetical protein